MASRSSESMTVGEISAAIVASHASYGLRVRLPSGEEGVVDRARISDDVLMKADWPLVGETITVTCEGHTSGSRYTGPPQLRLSARSSDMELARRRGDHGAP